MAELGNDSEHDIDSTHTGGVTRALIEVHTPHDRVADMTAINRLSRTKLDEEQVYIFDAVISNNQMDAYWTRMAKSSLRNYAKGARAGVALMNSHRTSRLGGLELPIGRSFRSELREEGDLITLTAAAYMVRGQTISNVSNDDIIQGIEAGTIFDVSIGFRGGWWRCGICNNDLFSRDCPHFPGWPDEDGNIAWAWVEDANLAEYSLVYDGATPGATILKARSLVSEGRLLPEQIDRAEAMLGVRLRPASIHYSPTVPTGKPATRRDTPSVGPHERTELMTGADLIADILRRGVSDTIKAQVEALHARCEAEGLDAASAALALSAVLDDQRHLDLKATIAELDQRIAELKPVAADGRAYRESLITETLDWGVRTYGNDFRRDMFERMLREPSRTLDDIRALKADFERLAAQRLGSGGRQTQSADPNDPLALGMAPPPPTVNRNLAAYTVGS